MAIKSIFILMLFLAAVGNAGSTGLIVAIDQKELLGVDNNSVIEKASQLSFYDVKSFGLMREPLSKLMPHLYEIKTVDAFVDAWNNARESWILERAGQYTHVYIAKGQQIRDDQYMTQLWREAIESNDQLDFVSLVPSNAENPINSAWNLPSNFRVRMLYSESSSDAEHLESLVRTGNVRVAASHAGKTAGVLFSSAFLSMWFANNTFAYALKFASIYGNNVLSIDHVCEYLKMFNGYEDRAAAKKGADYVHHLSHAHDGELTVCQSTIEIAASPE